MSHFQDFLIYQPHLSGLQRWLVNLTDFLLNQASREAFSFNLIKNQRSLFRKLVVGNGIFLCMTFLKENPKLPVHRQMPKGQKMPSSLMTAKGSHLLSLGIT